jgi:hypothetical protein
LWPTGGAREGGEEEEGDNILKLFLDRTADLSKASTRRHIRDVIMNFQIAGRDTVAQVWWMFSSYGWSYHMIYAETFALRYGVVRLG